MKSRILLVEDDPALLQVLHATAEFGGFTSDEVRSAGEAITSLISTRYDAVLLDLTLPDSEGGALIQQIRQRSDIPILVVSAHDVESIKIEALDSGADDFVAKPFLPGELLARLRAVIRRHRPGQRVPAPREVSVSIQDWVPGGSQEEKLFKALLASRTPLNSEQIREAVWGPGSLGSQSNVRVLIAALRRRLRDQGAPWEVISEHGRGYVLRKRRQAG